MPAPKTKVPIKGELKNVKIDGQTGKADYAVNASGPDSTVTQAVTFSQVNGSWKIANKFLFLFPPEQ